MKTSIRTHEVGWSNRIYELIKSKELHAFVFQGSYIMAKADLIETIVEAIRICQTTVTDLKIQIRAEWSESPTVLTTTEAVKLVGCSNSLIISWMKEKKTLRYIQAQNGLFTTKEWLIDCLARYTKERSARYMNTR